VPVEADEHVACVGSRKVVEPIGGSAEQIAREASRRERGLLADVVDAHVHLFPDGFYRALWRWFDAHAWEIEFRGTAEQVIDELARTGVGSLVALVYAHKQGAAAVLNQFLADLCRREPRIVGVGTVLPGEPGARDVVRDAIRVHGLRGIKLHCHVQRMAIDDPRMMEVLAECQALGVPAVVHAGRQPRSTKGYAMDPFELCAVGRTERVLRELPRLRLVVPHLGLDEIDAYLDLLDAHEHLYLDTSTVCADWLEVAPDFARVERHAGRIAFGSDFPITPYGAGRELAVLARRIVSDDAFARIVGGTARAFWQIG